MIQEVWIDPATNRIVAVYENCRSDGSWAALGYVAHDRVPAGALPMVPPEPTADELRAAELVQLQGGRDLDLAELNELSRLLRSGI